MQNQELFILPFDHRGSFQEKLFGIKGRQPTADETRMIASYKEIIYEGFLEALRQGAPQSSCAVLVDEQFGADIAQDARRRGITLAMPIEKSGQEEFDFEYGDEFAAHVERFNPDFVKVLVRYNPDSDAWVNGRQLQRLRRASEFCRRSGHKFLFELLVPPTSAQLARVGGEMPAFDQRLRPRLMALAMEEIQRYGIEPDIWKVEGIESPEASQTVANQARAEGRHSVGVIVLGRGENEQKVRSWLSVAAKTPGLIGFAVGRTVFWEPLKGVLEQRLSRREAVAQIAATYRGFCNLWAEARLPQMSQAA